jgi:hypothetical protein
VGSIGEPGLPGVRPAVVDAVAALTGHRVRNPLMSKVRFGTVWPSASAPRVVPMHTRFQHEEPSNARSTALQQSRVPPRDARPP